MNTKALMCRDCNRWASECHCVRNNIWHRLSRLPSWQQWSLIGIFYAGVMALFLVSITAHAQTSIPRTSAQLSFTPPTTNTDGTTIPTACATGVTQCGALSLHRIEYGTCNAGAFGTKQGEITVAMPATTATVSSLVVQVYCFRVFARNDYGSESAPSSVATKTIAPPTPSAPLLSQTSVAYEIRLNTSGVLVARTIGVIPRGSACLDDEMTVGTIHFRRIDRSVVDLIAMPLTDPLTAVWAVCG